MLLASNGWTDCVEYRCVWVMARSIWLTNSRSTSNVTWGNNKDDNGSRIQTDYNVEGNNIDESVGRSRAVG